MNPFKSTTRKSITSLLAIVFCVQSLTAATFRECECRRLETATDSKAGCCCCSAGECSTGTCCCSNSAAIAAEEQSVKCQCGHQTEPAVPSHGNVDTFDWSSLVAVQSIASCVEPVNSRVSSAAANLMGMRSTPSLSVQVLCCIWLT